MGIIKIVIMELLWCKWVVFISLGRFQHYGYRNNTLPMTIPVFNNNFDIIIDFIFIQIILYFIFNQKKIMKLEDKYKDKEVFSKNNILTVVFAFIIPLVVAFTFIQLRIMNIYLW